MGPVGVGMLRSGFIVEFQWEEVTPDHADVAVAG